MASKNGINALPSSANAFLLQAVTTLVTSLMGQKRHGSGSSGFCVTFPPYGSSPFTFLRSWNGDPNHVLLVTTSKKWPLSKCSKLKLLHKTFWGLPKVFFISKHRSTPFYIPYQVCLFFYEITFSILLLKCSKRFINDSYYICIYALKRSVFSNITWMVMKQQRLLEFL